MVSTTKQKVDSLLSQLPEDCSLEDVQYHLLCACKGASWPGSD